MKNSERIAYIEFVETLSLVELKSFWNLECDTGSNDSKFKCEVIFSRTAQIIAESDSAFDPESGGPEPDFEAAAGQFLNR